MTINEELKSNVHDLAIRSAELLLEHVNEYVPYYRSAKYLKYTTINMLFKLGSIMDLLRSISSSMRLEILVARQFPRGGKSDLNLLLENGKVVPVEDWKTIGDGSDNVAKSLVEDFWSNNNDIKMKDFAKLGHCIIKFIEKEELTIGVGVGASNPSIRYLEHGADLDVQPNQTDFDLFDSAYESLSRDFQKKLVSSYYDLKKSTKQLKERFTIS